MNKINDLAEIAAKQSPDGYPVILPYNKDHINKLSQLILEECFSILEKRAKELDSLDLTEYNRGWVNGRLLAVEQIKHHFRQK